MKKIFKIILLTVFSGYLLTSCRKPKCDENIPVIAFQDFLQYPHFPGQLVDSAKITISFKDCDGDLGLEEKDTLGPFDPSSKYYHNFVLQYFEMVNGSWVNKCDTCIRYRFPKLVPEGQSKILEGIIAITISPYYYDDNSLDSDSIKFSVTIYDRKLNESNRAETPLILTR